MLTGKMVVNIGLAISGSFIQNYFQEKFNSGEVLIRKINYREIMYEQILILDSHIDPRAQNVAQENQSRYVTLL